MALLTSKILETHSLHSQWHASHADVAVFLVGFWDQSMCCMCSQLGHMWDRICCIDRGLFGRASALQHALWCWPDSWFKLIFHINSMTLWTYDYHALVRLSRAAMCMNRHEPIRLCSQCSRCRHIQRRAPFMAHIYIIRINQIQICIHIRCPDMEI